MDLYAGQAAYEFTKAVTAKPVIDIFATLFGREHPAVFQNAEMTGYGRYIPLGAGVQFAHAFFPFQ